MQIERSCLRRALARQTSCLCPADKLAPPSASWCSRPFSSVSVQFFRCANSIAFHKSASEYSENGSRFFRKVAEKSVASWGIIVSCFRSWWRPCYGLKHLNIFSATTFLIYPLSKKMKPSFTIKCVHFVVILFFCKTNISLLLSFLGTPMPQRRSEIIF